MFFIYLSSRQRVLVFCMKLPLLWTVCPCWRWIIMFLWTVCPCFLEYLSSVYSCACLPDILGPMDNLSLFAGLSRSHGQFVLLCWISLYIQFVLVCWSKSLLWTFGFCLLDHLAPLYSLSMFDGLSRSFGRFVLVC